MHKKRLSKSKNMVMSTTMKRKIKRRLKRRTKTRKKKKKKSRNRSNQLRKSSLRIQIRTQMTVSMKMRMKHTEKRTMIRRASTSGVKRIRIGSFTIERIKKLMREVILYIPQSLTGSLYATWHRLNLMMRACLWLVLQLEYQSQCIRLRGS
jgi:hypothetical protein